MSKPGSRTSLATPIRRNSTAQGFGEISTEIKPLNAFYYAEDYHQQYLRKGSKRLLRSRRHLAADRPQSSRGRVTERSILAGVQRDRDVDLVHD